MHNDWIKPELMNVLQAEGTTIHRVYTGYEGWVERYGEDFLLCAADGIDTRQWADKINEWGEENGLIVDRVFYKQLQTNPTEQSHYELLTGQAQAAIRTRCQELGIKYWVDFASGYSNGFFPDQRENRRFLRQLLQSALGVSPDPVEGIKPQRVLNLFSYTCSFSVAAALGGAETCSVDVAKKALDWGKENFALNGLTTTGHRFMTDDARESVRRMIKRGEKFEVIICDPPTFGRNREGKVWKIDKDLAGLVGSLLEILSPQGYLLLSTNFAEWGEEHLTAMVPDAEVHSVPHCADLPEDVGARTVWLRR